MKILLPLQTGIVLPLVCFYSLDKFSSIQATTESFQVTKPPWNGFSTLMETFLAGIVRNEVKK